jgi:hypothetical protein
MHFVMKVCTNVSSEAIRLHDRYRRLWHDNIKMDIGRGCTLHPACSRQGAMAGRFENCKESSAFIKDPPLIDAQSKYHLHKEDNTLRSYLSEVSKYF